MNILQVLRMTDEEWDDFRGAPIEPHAGDGDYYRQLAAQALTESGRRNWLRLAERCDRQGIEGRVKHGR